MVLLVTFCRQLVPEPGGGGGGVIPLCGLNGDVRSDRVWFSGCFVLNGVSISSLSVLALTGYRYMT